MRSSSRERRPEALRGAAPDGLVGIEGKLFRPMATTVLLALAGAFLLSLTVVPVLTSYLVRQSAGAHDTWLLRKAHALYAPALAFALRRRWPSRSKDLSRRR